MKNLFSVLLFALIGILSNVNAEELVFEYKGRYSNPDIMVDRPATNTGLHWMKKKKKEPKLVIREKRKESKQYLCYGSLRSTADAFSGPSSSCGRCSDDGVVYVKSHTRRLRSGKIVRVRAHWRRK